MSNLGSLGSRPRRSSTNGILSGFGAVPSQWTADSRVKALQAALNAQMGGVGCTTALKTDGLIGPMTCGALAWSKATGSPPTAYTAYASDMDSGCRPIAAKAPACPTAVVPSPAAAVVAPAPMPGPAPSDPLMVAPVATRAPATPVVVTSAPPAYVPSEAIVPQRASSSGGGLNMKTVAIIGGAVVAVGLGVFLLTGKKKSAPAKAA